MKQNYQIASIYMLTDALERKLLEFNAMKNLNNVTASNEFESLKSRCIRLRKYMDKYLKEFSEGWGDEADEINELIENYIKSKL